MRKIPLTLALFALACAEAAPVDESKTTPDGGDPADLTTADGGGTNPTAPDGGITPSLAASAVFNEIRATGDEYVELANPGAEAFDLSDWKLADKDSSGAPKLAEALTFPAGTTIAAGGHLLVMTGIKTPVDGPQSSCGATGATTCFQALFGVSASKGDELFLIDGSGKTVAQASYPANAVADGRAFGRLPDGTGDFADCASTPGAANAL